MDNTDTALAPMPHWSPTDCNVVKTSPLKVHPFFLHIPLPPHNTEQEIWQHNRRVVKPFNAASQLCRKVQSFWKQPHPQLVMWEHHIDYCFYHNRYWPPHQRGSAEICSPSNSTELEQESFSSNHHRSTLIQKTAEHLKGNKICTMANAMAESDLDW